MRSPPGKHTIRMDFAYDGGGIGKGGTATLAVDGKEVAKGRVERTVPDPHLARRRARRGRGHRHAGEPQYDVPFKFTGEVGKVTIDLK